jgi:hypothetical protein
MFDQATANKRTPPIWRTMITCLALLCSCAALFTLGTPLSRRWNMATLVSWVAFFVITRITGKPPRKL